MNGKLLVFTLLSLTLLLPACDCNDDPVPTSDGFIRQDGLVTEAGSDGVSPGSKRDNVIFKMVVPTDDTTSKKYAYDIDKDGKVDNAIGAVLTAIKSAATGIDMQKDMNQNIWNGNVLSLLQVKSTDFSNSTSATLQGWTGEKVSCCTTKPCAGDTTNTCFAGTYKFKPDSNSPTNSVLNGSIKDGLFTMGPGKIEVQLPIGKYPARVTLLAAKVEGKITSSGIIEGKMMGAISQTDLKNSVLPSVAKVLNGEMNDSTTAQATKDAIKKAFDSNGDWKITEDEVKANAAVKAILVGDVDADGDGKKEELSAGVGFETTLCEITTK